MIKGLLFLVLLTLPFACSEVSPDYPSRTVPAGLLGSRAAQGAGARMFRHKCASCHGHPSEGRSERADFFDPPAPDFSESHYRDIDPAYLYWRIEHGKTIEPFRSRGSVMPTWGPHLSETEIWSLVVYLLSRSRPAFANGSRFY
ncbi:c-type cytochrome [Geothermobacter hydrogeniphilus]|uniref:Cytochrome c domain-containing protein n=1 Tax=Geothermobacter hydrogeniphilus TaxID=1969733 RepID=A0A1X0YAD9_9BACT|nr:cytochrome c [Geothermobacter hydrogeniphilus]ORJ62190.1 hypothetical protein B5V00_05440 [Geothermobacter hydrogeniphilus]